MAVALGLVAAITAGVVNRVDKRTSDHSNGPAGPVAPSSSDGDPGDTFATLPLLPLSPSAPNGPVGPAYPPGPAPGSSTSVPPNVSSTTTSPGATSIPVQTTIDDGSGQSTVAPTSTTVDYPQFECIVRVSQFVGGPTGQSRRVKVNLRVSTTAVRYVWAETRWDEEVNVQTVTMNPEGRIEFLVFAPGTQWPVVRVYASSDVRPQSQMCSS